MTKSKVLIVDDEEDVVAALQFRLATAGYEVLAASNGAEALEVLKREAVDLVLADFMMPEINGLELTRLVKANPNWFETRIVLFSCNSEPEFRKRALELGALDYLPKTDGANSIVARVYEILSPEAKDPSPLAGAEPWRVSLRRTIASPLPKSGGYASPSSDGPGHSLDDPIRPGFRQQNRRRHQSLGSLRRGRI